MEQNTTKESKTIGSHFESKDQLKNGDEIFNVNNPKEEQYMYICHHPHPYYDDYGIFLNTITNKPYNIRFSALAEQNFIIGNYDELIGNRIKLNAVERQISEVQKKLWILKDEERELRNKIQN